MKSTKVITLNINKIIILLLTILFGFTLSGCKSKSIVPKQFHHDKTSKVVKAPRHDNNHPKHMIIIHGNSKSESFFTSGANEPSIQAIYNNLNQQSDNYENHIKNFKQYNVSNSQITSKANSTYYVKTIQLTRK